ncbi:pyridoxamine 5'-phosphate oxidase family protein [soil metagenome]
MTDTKSLDELLDPGAFVMLMTMIDGVHSSRPITVAEVDGSSLRFLVDDGADWMQAVVAGRADTHGTVSDNRSNTFLAFNASTAVSKDRAEIDRLWNPAAGAYFDGGKDDPGVAVLTVDVSGGEYWDSPSGRIGSVISMVRAAVGQADDAGERGNIET